MWMTFNYEDLTLEDIEGFEYYEFICDGDNEVIVAIPKRED